MYAQFFGLKREPFSIAPDPRYLFMSERHREALAHLLYGLNGGGGFVMLTGEIGAGKTTVCRCFLEQIPEHCNVAYIFNPKLTVIELLQSVCSEFHITVDPAGPGGATVKDYVDALNAFLLQAHGDGRNNILIIDEAQNLSADVLEQLRLLTNLETSERKLLQVILIGQPELRSMLAQPGLEQLAQRVIARYHLEALSEAETAQYIRYRLAVGGFTKGTLFDRQATRRIYKLSRGVPRRINLLCDRSLLGAYAETKAVVDRDIVDKAALEVFGKRVRKQRAETAPRSLWPVLMLGMASGAVLLGVAAWHLNPSASRQLLEAGTALGRPPVAAPAAAPAPASAPPPGAAASPVSAAASANDAVLASGLDGSAVAVVHTTPPAAAPLVDLRTAFNSLFTDEQDAWRELAPQWKLNLDGGDPCASAQRQQVRCFRGNSSLSLIRQLNRPGVLTLRDDTNRTGYAVLTGLTDQTATVRVAGGAPRTVSLVVLAQLWRGDYATFWRAPPGYVNGVVDGSSGPAVDWLDTQLTALQGSPRPGVKQNREQMLRSRVYAFQLAQGLKADGLAGPTTFMQLNRSAGIDEPRLRLE